MQSNGGLAEEKTSRYKSILSGPAGGVMGAISVGKTQALKKL